MKHVEIHSEILRYSNEPMRSVKRHLAYTITDVILKENLIEFSETSSKHYDGFVVRADLVVMKASDFDKLARVIEQIGYFEIEDLIVGNKFKLRDLY